MPRLVYLNDQFIHEEKAVISYLDLSFQRGYAVFDFFRLVGNEPLHLEDHLDRFYFSAAELRLPIGKTRDELKQIIKELLWENEIPNTGVRLQLSGGEYSNGAEFISPTLIISHVEFTPPSLSMLEAGIQIISYPHQRQLPQVKSTDYLMSIWLQPLLTQKKADDIVYHSSGLIRECPRSNFFIISATEKLITPGDQVLKGITRMKVIQLASMSGMVEEREITLEEALNAKEAFITSTTKQIVPVVQIDGKPIGDGKPGRVTKNLMRELRRHCGIESE